VLKTGIKDAFRSETVIAKLEKREFDRDKKICNKFLFGLEL